MADAGFSEIYNCSGDGCAECPEYRTFHFFRANPNLKLSCKVPDNANWGMAEKEPRSDSYLPATYWMIALGRAETERSTTSRLA